MDYEKAFNFFMGDFTSRSCIDIYINVYVNSHERKLREGEKEILNEIFKRSGGVSTNPYIFGRIVSNK
jgi:hypothetical protein